MKPARRLRLAVCAIVLIGGIQVTPRWAGASDTASALPLDPAISAYWRDLGDTLAKSDDAHALLAAALADSMAHPPGSPERFNDLIARAQKASPDDALIAWIAATQCRPTRTDCNAAQHAARERLFMIDGQNAAVWLLEANAREQRGDHAAAASAFSRAAAAAHYDDYTIRAAQVLAGEFLAHPPAPAVLRRAQGAATSPEIFANVSAWAITAALVLPQVDLPFKVCTPDRKPVADAVLRAECGRLARTMQTGDSLMAASTGFALERRLLAQTPAATESEQRWQRHRWMLAQLPALAKSIDSDSPAGEQYRRDLYRTNNESDALASLMAAQGIALDPPDDWKAPPY